MLNLQYFNIWKDKKLGRIQPQYNFVVFTI